MRYQYIIQYAHMLFPPLYALLGGNPNQTKTNKVLSNKDLSDKSQ